MAKQEERHDLTPLEQLEQIRDIARVQAHLFREELKDEWEDLEAKWKQLHRRVPPVRRAAGDSVAELRGAGSEFIDSLTEGYKRIIQAAKKSI